MMEELKIDEAIAVLPPDVAKIVRDTFEDLLPASTRKHDVNQFHNLRAGLARSIIVSASTDSDSNPKKLPPAEIFVVKLEKLGGLEAVMGFRPLDKEVLAKIDSLIEAVRVLVPKINKKKDWI